MSTGFGTKVREKNQEEGQFKARTLCEKRKECGTPNYNTERQENGNYMAGTPWRDQLGHPPCATRKFKGWPTARKI